MLAFWLFGDFVTGGYAPYLDLPATGMDTYGRSGRGYGEGRFRGERMLYGEIEYRASLMRNGLVGMVVFLNLTTITNLETGERLFHTVAPGAGAGLRLLDQQAVEDEPVLRRRVRQGRIARRLPGRPGSVLIA